MTEEPNDNTSQRSVIPAREVRVVNWPLRDRPAWSASALLACAGVGVVAGFVAASWSMGLLALAVMALSCWKLWIPVAGLLGPQGVTISVGRWRRRIAWRDIDRVELLEHGVLLRPASSDALLGGFESVYLPWAKHRELVAEFHDFYRPGLASRGPAPSPADSSPSGADAT